MNTILMFACGLLLGLLLRKHSGARAVQSTETKAAGAETRTSPFRMTMTHTPGTTGISSDDEAFSPQLANLQIALGNARAPGKAYSAARAAGILR